MFSSHNQPVFLGEAYKFSPNPFHKKGFEPYKPLVIPTQEKNFQKVSYPYTNMRFDHLKTFYIPPYKNEHPYAKQLHIEPIHKSKYDAEVKHLGIKEEMEKESRPNEVKLQMGLGARDYVKDFAVQNLQQDEGIENNLTRHRDEKDLENTTVLPFEERYLNFLNSKKENTKIDNEIEKIKGNSSLKEEAKNVLVELKEKSKKVYRKKTKVQPIEHKTIFTSFEKQPETTPPPPVIPTKRVYKKRKTQGEEGFVAEEVEKIEKSPLKKPSKRVGAKPKSLVKISKSGSESKEILERFQKIMEKQVTPVKKLTSKSKTEKSKLL